ncbi:MAG: ABC transporter ATP-binding protein [Planctomycetes bacterium]|nr:ABC transporter ATP-binding protein [Planctomycetota bacterium]
MSYLNIEHVGKDFPNREGGSRPVCVLDDVSLSIERGEFLTVVGHSGCGKSTLLNILAGFEKATRGHVVLDGKPVAGPGLDRMVVFQNFALLPWVTAFENVRLAVHAAFRDWDRAKVRAHTEKYFRLMGLAGAEHKRPAHLSGGMRQRVGLARAFAVEPKILLLDEPFAQIDALTRGSIQEELIKLWSATGQTIFLVTHDVDEAILLSDRIVLMTNGPKARVADCIQVDIPRPRVRTELIDLPEYTRLRSKVLHFLMEHAGNHRTPERIAG